MNDLFKQKWALALAKDEIQRIKNFVEQNAITIDSKINSFGAFVEKFTNSELDLAKILSVVTIEEKDFVVSATDIYLQGDLALNEKIVAYLQGFTSENPLANETPSFKLNVATTQDIVNAAIALVDINGATTTLEVKTYLRDQGFQVKQEEVSQTLNEMYQEHYLSFDTKRETIGNKVIQFRNYKPGDEYDQLAIGGLIPYDSEDNDDTVNDNNSANDTINTNVVVNSTPGQYATLTDRNREIQSMKNLGHTIKEIAGIFQMSERNCRKIVYGK